MQSAACYLLEYNATETAQIKARKSAIEAAIHSWLSEKGVTDASAASGAFTPATGRGNGSFRRDTAINETDQVEAVTLEEVSPAGLRFVTTLSVRVSGISLSVYGKLSAKQTTNTLVPLVYDAKCPSVIRSLLGQFSDWSFGGYPLPRPQPRFVRTEEDVVALCDEINSSHRTLPVLVVSFVDGHAIWPNLAQKLATDLSGLGAVAALDENASWSLTDRLGKSLSSYNGAIRLYWPLKRAAAAHFIIPNALWTAGDLLKGNDECDAEQRFRKMLRSTVLGVAARAIPQPPTVDDLRRQTSESRLRELEAHNSSMSEEIQIARMYLNDNAELRRQLEDARGEIAQLSSKLAAAEFAIAQIRQAEPEGDEHLEEPAKEADPTSGDVRYYKKIHSKPQYDVFVSVGSCGHNTWQGSSKAEKAKKGLERLFGGQTWKNLHHCGSCSGGGLWRVTW